MLALLNCSDIHTGIPLNQTCTRQKSVQCTLRLDGFFLKVKGLIERQDGGCWWNVCAAISIKPGLLSCVYVAFAFLIATCMYQSES